MKAKYVYRSGHKLLIPKNGFAPLLFLEFLRDNDNLFRPYVLQTTNKSETDFLLIKCVGCLKEDCLNAIDYINNNLPI